MALPGPQQPQQLLPVQPVAADDHAVQQQHGNVESVAPGKHRIVIHVEHREGRQGHRGGNLLQLFQEFLAKAATGPP